MTTQWRRDMQTVFDDVIALHQELLPKARRPLFRATRSKGFQILYTRDANLTILGDMTLHLPEWEWPDNAREITVGAWFQPGQRTRSRVQAQAKRYVRIRVGDVQHGSITCSWRDGRVYYADGVRKALKSIGFY
jgi:hypothetical protein